MPGTSTTTAGKPKELPKDFDKIFDKRLKNFCFTAIPPKLEEWKGSSIVRNVFDVEINVRNFKSTEERIIYRMELWIDACRIETFQNGALTNGAGKFHSAKRFRKPTTENSKLMKVRSFSMGRATSQSMESLDKPILKEPMKRFRPNSGEFVNAVESAASARIAPAKSTGDLLMDRRKITEREIDIEFQKTSDRDIEQTFDKFGTNPKRKLKFFLFRKKDKSEKSNDNDGKEHRRSSFGNKKNKGPSKSKKGASNEHQHQQQRQTENNNIGVTSQPRIRPSVFDMESLKGSFPDLHERSYEYDPAKRNKNKGTRENNTRFNTISTPSNVRKEKQEYSYHHHHQQQQHHHQQHHHQQQQQQQQETLFKTRNHNDSVKRQKSKSRSTSEAALFAGPVFFDPHKKDRREASVRTELGQI